jgi:hypothetical protein
MASACGDSSGSGAAGSGASGPSGGGGANSQCEAENLDACDYPSPGLTATKQEGIAITDNKTGRELPLLVRIPEGEGPFPLVVWSHGGGFSQAGHKQAVEWGTTLAEHGYAVLHIAHVPPTLDSAAALCELGSVPPADCTVDAASDEDDNGLIALVKTLDVIAVLDRLPQLSEASVEAGGPAIDLDKVAVAGWSAGARAPIVTHGARFQALPNLEPITLTHDLPRAAVALSPMGPGYAGFFDEADGNTWEDMRAPVFMATGDNDLKASKPDVSGADRRIAFERQPADGQRWLLYSTLTDVGGHPSFNLEDQDSSDERLVRLSRALSSGVRAFLDAKLLNSAAGEAWLASNNAQTLAGEAEWINK